MLTAFQPGGLTEKPAILDALTRPAPGNSIGDTLVSLRTWDRLKKRAEELKATIPDPSILVMALGKLCGPVINASASRSFRISLFRHELHIDMIPTYEKVESLSQVILAELEGAVGIESQAANKDRVALLQTESNEDGKSKGKGSKMPQKVKSPLKEREVIMPKGINPRPEVNQKPKRSLSVLSG